MSTACQIKDCAQPGDPLCAAHQSDADAGEAALRRKDRPATDAGNAAYEAVREVVWYGVKDRFPGAMDLCRYVRDKIIEAEAASEAWGKFRGLEMAQRSRAGQDNPDA